MFKARIVKREFIVQRPPMRGLGDLVARFAKPISTVIKHDCHKRCDKWQEYLNGRFQFRLK